MQILAAKARSSAHEWFSDNAKDQIIFKKIKLGKGKLRLNQKKDKRLPGFFCLIIIILKTDRQTDRQKSKNRGT